MEFTSFLTLFGGLAFFIFGMKVMSENLEKMAGGQLEGLLKRMTANPFVSLFLGAAITIAMQSSSATTVLLVGLVNSGILTFSQTISVIFGANIGTTLTAWILSLSGIDSSVIWIQMLKPINFSPVLAFLGVLFLMIAKSDRKHNIGKVLIGFAVMMYGMTMMADAVSPLAEEPFFADLLVRFRNPLIGLLVALMFTALVQSSAASIGIIQALSLTGGLSYGIVIPMVMGLNIGTCATSLLSCIGTGTGAKRVATVHLMIKVLGALVCLPLFLLLNLVFQWSFVDQPVTPVTVALIHTAYNIVVTLILMPFSKWLVRLTERLLPEGKKTAEQKDDTFSKLDDLLLRSPSVAIAECHERTVEMCDLAYETLIQSIGLMGAYDETAAGKILENEEKIDGYEDKLGSYLVKISAHAVSETDGQSVSMMLHTIGDFERLGDHAVNLVDSAKEIKEKSVRFSDEATAELAVLTGAVKEILLLTTETYRDRNAVLAGKVEPLEQVIDGLIEAIRDHHISRLRAGNCTIETGFVLSDLLTNFERISDHCSNVAIAVIETARGRFDTHRYLNQIKEHDGEFRTVFERYSEKYHLA